MSVPKTIMTWAVALSMATTNLHADYNPLSETIKQATDKAKEVVVDTAKQVVKKVIKDVADKVKDSLKSDDKSSNLELRFSPETLQRLSELNVNVKWRATEVLKYEDTLNPKNIW